MTMTYQHFPPGHRAPQKGERLRSWVGDSPYFKNRPLRGPRGGDVLRLLRKPITFRNVPRLIGVTVHTFVKGAIEDSAPLHVAGMAMQAITNVRVEAHKTKQSVAGFGIREGQYLSVTCELQGEDMHHFLSKTLDVVMPKIKDWKGVKGSSGDSSGHLAFGLSPEQVALYPEIEVNYDMCVTSLTLRVSCMMLIALKVPSEIDPGLPCYDPNHRHQRSRRQAIADTARHSILRETDQLKLRSRVIYFVQELTISTTTCRAK